MVRHAFLAHQLVVAHQYHVLVHYGAHAMAAFFANIGNTLLVDFAREGFLHRHSDGVVGIRFGMRSNGKNEVGVNLGRRIRVHGNHVEAAVGKRARFVEHHGFGVRQRLQVVAALNQNTQARCAADATEERKGHRNHQSARARYNQEGKAALDPVRPALAEQQRRQHRQQQRADGDDGRVVASETRDEVFGLRLLLAGVFHQLEDARNGGLLEGLAYLHRDLTRHVHAAGNYLGALFHVARHRFASKRCRVKLGRAFDDGAVQRNALAGLHHNLVAHADFVRVDFYQLAIAHDVGIVGGNIHHIGNGLARFTNRIALEQLAYLVEQHYRGAFGHVRVGIGEQHQGKRANRGNGHKEVLVEHLAVADVARRLQQNVVTRNKVRDKEQNELKVQRVRLTAHVLCKRHEFRYREHRSEDNERRNNTVARPFLLLVHVESFRSVCGCIESW